MNKYEESRGVVRVADLDPDFKSEVLNHEGAQGLNACFACGACTAGCPIHEVFPEYSPRKLAKMVKLGMRKEVLNSPFIWYCVTCHNCENRCPQNVKFFNILNVLKNMAAEQGYAPSPWVKQTQQIMRTGLIFQIDRDLAAKRKARSLPVLKSNSKKVKKIIELVGLDKINAKNDDDE
ncbi:MAG: 4Fe-4S dicluster domain-containing protein [Candidatus Aminicenantes bacterium]|nr:4Fe-4S dicluster domain-containing protein [Candidatus Aminicenantes bacterium]